MLVTGLVVMLMALNLAIGSITKGILQEHVKASPHLISPKVVKSFIPHSRFWRRRCKLQRGRQRSCGATSSSPALDALGRSLGNCWQSASSHLWLWMCAWTACR